MVSAKITKESRAMRYGRLLASLEMARSALNAAACHRDLLQDEAIERLARAEGLLIGVEQTAWAVWVAPHKPTKKRSKR
jgi:hypothetical protein